MAPLTRRRLASAPAILVTALAALVVAAQPRPAAAEAPQADRRPTLVILRHGESTANVADQLAGTLPGVKLTPKGRAMARTAGENIRALGIQFDHAYVSELRRAQHTLNIAKHAARQDAVPTERTAALNERGYGILEGETGASAAAKYGEERALRWRKSWDEKPPGGESLHEVYDRAGTFLDDTVLPRLRRGENILLATHRRTVQSLVGKLEGLTPEQMGKLKIPNGEPIVYRLERNGQWTRTSGEIPRETEDAGGK